ncbi:hypothetical protein FW778_02925 [Ginsengibacter hankyongi]|uniref:PRTase-CE domain-containing protein n=1 Tax=Ginsengibacter hankyongi TaxID=2607284 RepID=A0A5J5IKC2_9BACT|nr:hypothetical protein [Ginsengibacter hankyongi]KAA9041008.1 hypothetical protein FW778_02925 [Ginsengibacter hankyongi]
MRTTLAETLLTKIMEWTPDEIDCERPLLQAMANLKWNEYQQFAPGTRFLESLVKWLQQFNSLEDKKSAYKLVREHLIFVSSEQMAHLVDILFSEKVNPLLIKKTAAEKRLASYLVTKILNDLAYENNLRMSLFIGLSDGSRIDQFRRGAYLNNEQVISTYDISPEKVKDMLDNLEKDVPGAKFKTIFLIDDFTASGKTFCRSGGRGKLGKIFKKIFFEENSGFKSAVDFDKIEVHILFYIATSDAIDNITAGITEWKEENGIEFPCTVNCLLLIDDTTKNKIIEDAAIMSFISRYFDDTVVDEHYKKGKHELPYLGFNECGLPLVLNHNSPNNSIAIFWLPADKKYKGLFPRISRHREK